MISFVGFNSYRILLFKWAWDVELYLILHFRTENPSMFLYSFINYKISRIVFYSNCWFYLNYHAIMLHPVYFPFCTNKVQSVIVLILNRICSRSILQFSAQFNKNIRIIGISSSLSTRERIQLSTAWQFVVFKVLSCNIFDDVKILLFLITTINQFIIFLPFGPIVVRRKKSIFLSLSSICTGNL